MELWDACTCVYTHTHTRAYSVHLHLSFCIHLCHSITVSSHTCFQSAHVTRSHFPPCCILTLTVKDLAPVGLKLFHVVYPSLSLPSAPPPLRGCPPHPRALAAHARPFSQQGPSPLTQASVLCSVLPQRRMRSLAVYASVFVASLSQEEFVTLTFCRYRSVIL